MSIPSFIQDKILRFIQEFSSSNGFPPTIRDIQKGCLISSTSVVDHNLTRLQTLGKIRRLPNVSRGIELLDPLFNPRRYTLEIPLMGYISAGVPVPMPASEDSRIVPPLGYINLSNYYENLPKETYGLKVRGLSMKDALVDDGDIVIIDPTKTVRNGEMAISWLKLEEEATLKKIYYQGSKIVLQPANAEMEPLVIDRSNVEIQGKVIAVLRFLEDMIS